MANQFDLRKFLNENKLTRASKALNEVDTRREAEQDARIFHKDLVDEYDFEKVADALEALYDNAEEGGAGYENIADQLKMDNSMLVDMIKDNLMNEAPVKKAGNYLELQDEYYNYTNMSARAVGPSKTRVTLHQGDLYGEPDIKKVVDMPFSEFVEKLKAAGAEQDPANDTVFFDMNPDGVEEFLRTLGLDL